MFMCVRVHTCLWVCVHVCESECGGREKPLAFHPPWSEPSSGFIAIPESHGGNKKTSISS